MMVLDQFDKLAERCIKASCADWAQQSSKAVPSNQATETCLTETMRFFPRIVERPSGRIVTNRDSSFFRNSMQGDAGDDNILEYFPTELDFTYQISDTTAAHAGNGMQRQAY